MDILAEYQQQQETGKHGSQSDKSQLTIRHFQHTLEGLPPNFWAYQRQNTFQNQYKTKSCQQSSIQINVLLIRLLSKTK
jgi:hypothetical protein